MPAVPPLPVLTPGLDFDEAARLVLEHLRERAPMAFWSVTRVENGRQTYLHLDEDNGYGLLRGGSHPWEDSFCVHMAAGRGPSVAPVVADVPAYASAPVAQQVPIGAYAGAVISDTDGSLFGAICGLDPADRAGDPEFLALAPLLQLFGHLLTAVLTADRAREAARRATALAQRDAEIDALTALPNRRAWERLVAEESARFARLGDPTVVAVIDLDRLKAVNDSQGHAAGDDYLRRAAYALTAALRPGDGVARLGGDEFGVLMRDCTEADAPGRVDAFHASLEREGVAGSVGWAPITVLCGFPAALAEADAAMFRVKRERGAARLPEPREALDERALTTSAGRP